MQGTTAAVRAKADAHVDQGAAEEVKRSALRNT